MWLFGQNMKVVDYYRGNQLVSQTGFESAGALPKERKKLK